MERLKIFVVEDNESFLEGIILYLEQVLYHKVIGCASDGEKFLEQRKKYVEADIILMDINMPNLNGILTTKKLLWANHSKKVIALTAMQTTVGLQQLICAGFKACVFKNRVFDDLPDAVAAVTKGNICYPKNIRIETSNT